MSWFPLVWIFTKWANTPFGWGVKSCTWAEVEESRTEFLDMGGYCTKTFFMFEEKRRKEKVNINMSPVVCRRPPVICDLFFCLLSPACLDCFFFLIMLIKTGFLCYILPRPCSLAGWMAQTTYDNKKAAQLIDWIGLGQCTCVKLSFHTQPD